MGAFTNNRLGARAMYGTTALSNFVLEDGYYVVASHDADPRDDVGHAFVLHVDGTARVALDDMGVANNALAYDTRALEQLVSVGDIAFIRKIEFIA